MEFYTLDDSLRRYEVFDSYTSLIWTERYSSAGDFQMQIPSTRANRAALAVDKLCTVNDTSRVCKIETMEDIIDAQGVKTLKIAGRGIEAVLLEDRVAVPALTSLTAVPNWTLTGRPGEIARKIFTDICVTKVIMGTDGIPFYKAGSIFTPGTIQEPLDTVTMTLEIASVYTSLKKVCDMYNLGFRLARKGETSELYFDVYTGDNRTTQQGTFPAVVFSRELDNLSATNELISSALQKNVAYVMTPNGSGLVYASGWDATKAVGFNRRVLYVAATDITATGTALPPQIQQRGQEELAKNRAILAFDGEIPQVGSYSFGPGRDYDLGDIVEIRNSDGLANNLRVDEFIRTSDASGEKAYPTLVSELIVNPGSWLSFDAGVYWADAVGTWSDQ